MPSTAQSAGDGTPTGSLHLRKHPSSMKSSAVSSEKVNTSSGIREGCQEAPGGRSSCALTAFPIPSQSSPGAKEVLRLGMQIAAALLRAGSAVRREDRILTATFRLRRVSVAR